MSNEYIEPSCIACNDSGYCGGNECPDCNSDYEEAKNGESKSEYKTAKELLTKVLGNGYGDIEPLTQVGKAPIFFDSLALIYAPDGYGKSWQSASLLGTMSNDSTWVIYLDADGSNGKKFAQHCRSKGVEYVSVANVDSNEKTGLKKIKSIISNISKQSDKNMVFIVDSLTSLNDGGRINNAEDISPILYDINEFAQQTGHAIVVIDHATRRYGDDGTVRGFKLEGNEGGKKRPTSSVLRYEPTNVDKPQLGGTFTVERSRDADKFKLGDEFLIKGAKGVIGSKELK